MPSRCCRALLLEDGQVLVLTWEQMLALQCAFVEFGRLLIPAQLDKFGPARASVQLSQ